jgi:hypothetical protein
MHNIYTYIMICKIRVMHRGLPWAGTRSEVSVTGGS